MTQEQFNTWLDKKYPVLLKAANRMEQEPSEAEDLLHDTILYVLGHRSYEKLSTERAAQRNPLFWFYTFLAGVHQNRHKAQARRNKYDNLNLPEKEGVDPYPRVDAKIFVDQLYSKVSSISREVLSGMCQGLTVKETYLCGNYTNLTYSYYLRLAKAELRAILL